VGDGARRRRHSSLADNHRASTSVPHRHRVRRPGRVAAARRAGTPASADRPRSQRVLQPRGPPLEVVWRETSCPPRRSGGLLYVGDRTGSKSKQPACCFPRCLVDEAVSGISSLSRSELAGRGGIVEFVESITLNRKSL